MPESKLQQRFRGVLEGVPILPGMKGRDRVLQTFAVAIEPIEQWAAAIFRALTPEERVGASVRVMELTETYFQTIRPPAPEEKGPPNA